jgi:holo-[acyl-carrier protein] synthase
MIYGIGTDILKIERVRAALGRHGERFALRILGPDEMAIYQRRSARHAERGLLFLATRFAAKEAFAKALGLGIRTPMTWHAVQILKEASGKPTPVPNGPLAQWMAERHLRGHITVTDEAEYVAAFAVVEIHG